MAIEIIILRFCDMAYSFISLLKKVPLSKKLILENHVCQMSLVHYFLSL